MRIVLFYCTLFLFTSSILSAQNNSNDVGSITQSLMQQVLKETTDNTQPSKNDNLSIKEPIAPVLGDSKTIASNSPNNKQTKMLEIPGTIFLNNTQYYSGVLYIPDFSINIVNDYKNKEFIKELPISQIKSLTCIKWVATPFKQENKSFSFNCQLYNIKDQAGYNFVYKKPIAALQKILFKNSAGSTLFYSYFIDYQKNSLWSNLKIDSHLNTTSKPLEGVIRTIQFGTLDSKEVKNQNLIPAIPLIVNPSSNNTSTAKQKPIVKTTIININQEEKNKKTATKIQPQKNVIKPQEINIISTNKKTVKPIKKKNIKKEPIKKAPNITENNNEKTPIRSRR